jgi:hypothetical protein
VVPKAKTTMPRVSARHFGRPRLLALLDSASADDPATAAFDFLAHAVRAAALADLRRSEEAGVALRLAARP